MSLVRTRKKMKYLMPFVWMFLVIFVVGSVFVYGFNNGGGGASAGGPGEGAFAKINGEEVSQHEFALAIEQTRQQFSQYASMGSPMTLDLQGRIPVYAYDQLLESRTREAAARAHNVNVSIGDAQSEAERKVSERLKQIGEGSTPAEIAEMRNILLANINPEAERRDLARQRLDDKIKAEARPVEVKAAHILIKTEGKTEAAALQLARDIARRARTGEDFAKLAQQYSDDPVSKTRGGLFGWVSAQPPVPPTMPKKANPADPLRWEAEPTAAALLLKPNGVSDPVRAALGYEVVKVLEEREFQPKDAATLKDPKKKSEAIETYRTAAAQAIVSGIFSDFRARAQVQASDPWLQGHLAEQAAQKAMFSAPGGKPPTEAQRLAPALNAYAVALKENGPEVDVAFAYHVAQLYTKAGQKDKALEIYESWSERGEPEVLVAKGELLEGAKKKTEALDAYKKAMELGQTRMSGTPELFAKLAGKFKGLNHPELVAKAKAQETKKQAEQMARQQEMQREQQEMMKRAIAQAQKEAPPAADKKSGAPAGNAPAGKAPASGKGGLTVETPGHEGHGH